MLATGQPFFYNLGRREINETLPKYKLRQAVELIKEPEKASAFWKTRSLPCF